MFRAYGSFPNGGSTETSSMRSPLENIQTWGSSPIAPPPTPNASHSTSSSSSSPDFQSMQHTSQSNINNQRHQNIRHLHHHQQQQLQNHRQHSQFQTNLHAHQQQQKSQPFYIEAALSNNNNNNGLKNNDIKGIWENFYQLIFVLESFFPFQWYCQLYLFFCRPLEEHTLCVIECGRQKIKAHDIFGTWSFRSQL